MDEELYISDQFPNESIIVVEGTPIPAARPKKGKNGFYNPQKELMDLARWRILMQQENWHSMEGPLVLFVDFYMPIPKSLSSKKREILDRQPHTKKPDLSNLIKFIEDVLNGLLYHDDRQIVEIVAKKEWSLYPRTFIKLVAYE